MARPDLKSSRLGFERLDVVLACILAGMMVLAVIVVGAMPEGTDARAGGDPAYIAR
jgi:hypothetical protein